MNLALFGGTFDPIHRGHVAAALAAADAFRLDTILVIAGGVPPHKTRPDQADYEHRYRMVELACAHDSRLRPSRLEEPSKRGGRHYSFDTIARVKQQYIFDEPLRFIVGRDAFAEIHLWRRWEEVLRQVEFIVVSRPGGDLNDDLIPPGARVKKLLGPAHPASSSEIRRRVKIGAEISDLAPAAVCDYIREHGLYKPR